MCSCIFSIITSVFSVAWSSEIILIYWFAAQETFLIIINVENSCGNCDAFYFSLMFFLLFVFFYLIHRWIESSKEQHLFEVEIFCNIIHVFTVTFDQFNASLLNRNMNVFQKNLTDCKRQYYIIFTLCMCENKSHILTLKEVSELLELLIFLIFFFNLTIFGIIAKLCCIEWFITYSSLKQWLDILTLTNSPHLHGLKWKSNFRKKNYERCADE